MLNIRYIILEKYIGKRSEKRNSDITKEKIEVYNNVTLLEK